MSTRAVRLRVSSRPRTSVLILSAVLIIQAALFYGYRRTEVLPVNTPLSELPRTLNAWQMVSESKIEKEVLDVLKADETVSRQYAAAETPLPVGLFVAYFRSQRTGQAPHSPKNCMPGNGWLPTISKIIDVDIPGRGAVPVNLYVLNRGGNQDEKTVVLYWYQSRDRVVADEYRAKLYSMYDAFRYNRTDTALVRVVVPAVGGDDQAAAAYGEKFIRDWFGTIRRHFPA